MINFIITTLFILFVVYLIVGMNKQILDKNNKYRKKDEIID